MVEKKVQVPVEVPRPRPLSDDTGRARQEHIQTY